MKGLAWFALFLLLIGGVSYGAYGVNVNEEDKAAVLVARSQQLQCRAEFNIGLLEDSKKYYEQEQADELISEIESKMKNTVQEAESGDAAGYRAKRADVLESFRDARVVLREVKKNAIEGKTQQEKIEILQNMKTDITSRGEELEACMEEQGTVVIQKELEILKGFVESGNNIIEQMGEKGYETSELEGIIDDANGIISEVEGKIEDGQLTKDEREQIRENEWAQLLYLRAEFHAVRLQIYADKVGKDYSEYQDELQSVYENTDAVIGDSDKKLSVEERNDARENLKNARETLKSVIAEIRSKRAE